MSTESNTTKPSWIGELGEVVKDLNLPKHVLDKVTALAETLLGPSAREFGELFADKVRHRRLVNQISVFKRTTELLEANGLRARELSLKTLVPLLEQSSLEEDEDLQKRWANLIANMASSPENGLEPKLVRTLSNLTATEAKVLDLIHSRVSESRNRMFENRGKPGSINYASINDIPLESFLVPFELIQKTFSLEYEFACICLENLSALGLTRPGEPTIQIDHGNSDAELMNLGDRGQRVRLDLALDAHYWQSDDYALTQYGNYFVQQCHDPTSKEK